MSKTGIWAVITSGIISLSTATEYRAFTDTQGRVIEAKLIRFNESKNSVQVERKGKRSTSFVPLSIFSQADQKYIKSWNQNQAFLSDRYLSVDVNRIKKKDESEGAYSMATTYYSHCYNLELNNKSTAAFNNISVKYVIYYAQEHHINGRSDKEERFGTFFGEFTVDLPMRTEKEIKTDNIFLMTYRESGYDEVWPDLNGDIEGLIVKFSLKTDSGEEVIREFRHPEGFKKPWTTTSKNVEPKRQN